MEVLAVPFLSPRVKTAITESAKLGKKALVCKVNLFNHVDSSIEYFKLF